MTSRYETPIFESLQQNPALLAIALNRNPVLPFTITNLLISELERGVYEILRS